jgi:hypothetical protein
MWPGFRRVVALAAVAFCGCSDSDPILAPDTLIEVQPPALTNSARATFSFRAIGVANGFLCRIDGGTPGTCVPPVELELADGEHTFEVAATRDGIPDETPALVTWRIDTIAPETTLLAAPPAIDNNVEPEFAFEGSDDGGGAVTFECSLDGAAPAPCTSPFTLDVVDGNHTFTIAAVDEAGNRDLTPVVHDWMVTTVAPDTQLVAGPDPGAVTASSVVFEFTSPDPLATFECSLDGAAFAACTSPLGLSGLSDGPHELAVRAVGTAGPDPSPATRAWVVDAIAPVVTITGTPTNPSNVTTPQFTFTANEPATFQCQVDGVVAFTACSSPFQAPTLANGNRTFRVRATDTVGNLGNTATFSWVVDTVAPTVTITSQPAALSNNSSPTVAFTTAGGAVATTCQLDAATPVACTSPHTFASVADGIHTITVRATDAANNTGSATTNQFTIDTVPPTVAITSQPAALSNNKSPSVAFTVGGGAVTIQCRLDTGTFVACTSPHTFANVADGNHTISVRATDGAGNSATATTNQFTIDSVPPTVTITSQPAALSNNTSATVAFTAPGAASITCQLDTASPVACTSPHTFANVPDGSHTITVRATDAANNTGTATTSPFTVDTIPPTVTITGQPAALSNENPPTVTFTTGGSPTSTQCRVDAGTFVNCSGSFTPTVSDGPHTITIRVIDGAGNSAQATTSTFVVDTVAPNVTFTDAPPATWPVNYFDMAFTANETATFECSLNNAAFTACTSPTTVTTSYGIASNFRVRARDAAGNTRIVQTSWTSATGLVLHYPWEQGSTANTSVLAASPQHTSDGNTPALTAVVGGWGGTALGGNVPAHTYKNTRRALTSAELPGFYTASFWIRSIELVQDQTLLSTLGATGGFRVRLQSGSLLVIEVRNPNGALTTAETTITRDRWVHVALVATGPAKGLQVFLDGNFRFSVQAPQGTGFDPGQTADLTVGPWSGLDLDDLRFFNQGLDGDRVCTVLARGFRNANGACVPLSPGFEVDFERNRVTDTGLWKLPLSSPQTATFVTGKTGGAMRLASSFEWGYTGGFNANVNAILGGGRSFSLWFDANGSLGKLIDFRGACFVGGPPGTCGIAIDYTASDRITIFTGTDAGVQKSTAITVSPGRRNSIVVTEQRTDPKTTDSITVYVNGTRTVITIGAGDIYQRVADTVQFNNASGSVVDELEFWAIDLGQDAELLCNNGLDGLFDHVDGSCALTAN